MGGGIGKFFTAWIQKKPRKVPAWGEEGGSSRYWGPDWGTILWRALVISKKNERYEKPMRQVKDRRDLEMLGYLKKELPAPCKTARACVPTVRRVH